MDLYAENILDHYRSPRHKSPIEGATVTHEEKNPSCGDELTLSLKMEGGVIREIGWDGEGCAISQAGMSLLAEELLGKTVDEAEKLTNADIRSMLGVEVGPRRTKCALLAIHTLKNTLRSAENKPLRGWNETLHDNDVA